MSNPGNLGGMSDMNNIDDAGNKCAKILDGIAVACAIDESLKSRVAKLRAEGVNPTLGILRVGERADDISYEKSAIKRAKKIGISVEKFLLPESVSQSDILDVIFQINDDPNIDGLLMFRPLPKSVDEGLICDALKLEKDIDSGSRHSLSSLFTGSDSGFAPCTAQAVMEILDYYEIPVEGKEVVVVGRSLVIGKPLSMMLLARNATVTIAHSRTQNLAEITKRADIVVAAIGRAQVLDRNYFSPGQTVIDVGINFADSGKVVGDVDFEEAANIVDAITPVPRGVGSVTTSVLCKHVVEAASLRVV